MLVHVACLLHGYAPHAARSSTPRMQMTIDKVAVPLHDSYLSEVALTMPPAALSSVVGLLVSRGEQVVEPGRDASLHPLLVPLTRSADGCVTGLLRWPAGGGGGSKLPLVQTTSNGQVSCRFCAATPPITPADQLRLRSLADADADTALQQR